MSFKFSEENLILNVSLRLVKQGIYISSILASINASLGRTPSVTYKTLNTTHTHIQRHTHTYIFQGWATRVAQLVECLPSTQETLASILSTI